MRTLRLLRSGLALLLSVTLLPGCDKPDSDDDSDLVGNWVRSSDFDGNARSEAVIFTIDDKAYITTGTTDRERFKDLWEYDVDRKYWSQKADFEGAARSSAIGFAVNGKGYVGTGFDGISRLNDMWEYDPANNRWLRKTNFPGTARQEAVAFTIGTKAYLSCGFDGNYLKDLWEYNAQTDSWTQKASLGGSKRSSAMAFVLNDKAYVCSGTNNGTTLGDLWMYDATTNTWTEKNKIYNATDHSFDDKYSIQRNNGVAFVLGSSAYVTVGDNGSLVNTTWEYNPSEDKWYRKTDFEGTGRVGALAFTLKQRGFVMTGRSGSLSFDNMYEFKPADKYNKND